MTGWTRRIILRTGVTTAAWAAAPGILHGAEPEPETQTAHGRLRGAVERGVCVFRGIPYGGDVSLPEHRFKAPPPPPSWTGVRDATKFGAPAMQPAGGPPGGGEPAPSENCLYLNIWTPAADGGRRPVMFYCHGGGFTVGSGGRGYQNAANLAHEQDVVVVESNHRLGLFGYLYLGQLLGPEYEGNQGLLDLVAALRWVAENIAAFGGDPHNVMVFGESGGGGKASCLYAMPNAAPFFNKASIESPIGPFNFTPDHATEVAREAMRAFGLSDPRHLLEVPAAKLLDFQNGGSPNATPGTRTDGQRERNRDQKFWPMIDGAILPGLPFDAAAPAISAAKPLIVGGCKDEAVFFNFGNPDAFKLDMAGLWERIRPMLGDRTQAWIDTFSKSRPGASPSELYMAISTATPWRARAVHIAQLKAAQGTAPVYSYLLNYRSTAKVPNTDYPIGSPHASDIPVKFDNIDILAPSGGGPFGDNSPARKKTAINMTTMWASFARTGAPSAPGQPKWKPYTLARRETMLIDAQCRLVRDPEGDERRFWEKEPDTQIVR